MTGDERFVRSVSFTRGYTLQEIIAPNTGSSNVLDQSIFAWEGESGQGSFGMLARSQDQFVRSVSFRPIHDYRNHVRKYISRVSRVPQETTEYFRPDYVFTNAGLRIHLPHQMRDDYVRTYLMCVSMVKRRSGLEPMSKTAP